jgi:glucose/arabinose dehydrogenase
MSTKLVALILAAFCASAAPPPASVRVNVQVPASMRQGAFATNRTLLVPPGFRIAVVARIPGARFTAVAPNGDIFVSQPSAGKVVVIREQAGSDPAIFDFAAGLRLPHDIVFHAINGTMYVYIAESDKIRRTVYSTGDTAARSLQPLISGLPDASTPELNGPHAHALKNIALDRDHKLYVSSASTCNACMADLLSNPIRAAIFQYNADGSGERIFARGIRNAEGLAILPGTDQLWVVVNGRDEIRYPYRDATGNYGNIVRPYVDNHPPEIFTRVRDGGNYGWPFCNPTQDSPTGLDDMLLEHDSEIDPQQVGDCTVFDRPTRGIQAHSAPLGLSFLHESAFKSEYRFGAVAALHGSWNRSQPTGYKVVFFPWNSTAQRPEPPIDLVSGWLDTATASVWGRPVDAVPDLNGGLIISDDASGAIYRLSAIASSPCNFNLAAAEVQVAAGGGTGAASLLASAPSCAWAAASSASWLQVYPLAGSGSANIQYNIFPNFSSVGRTAIAQIGGRAMVIVQAAAQGTPEQRFVEQMYFNFLGRGVLPEETAVHLAALKSGLTRDALAMAFMNTMEFNLGGRFVAGLYVGLLARDAEYNGWLFQRNAMATGVVNPIELTSNFLESAEFKAKFGQLMDSQFVSLLYRNVLQREPRPDEVSLQANALRSGTPRAVMAYSFLNSAEFRRSAGPRLTAFLLYATLLLREPSLAERTVVMGQIAGGRGTQDLIAERINSTEFTSLLK